MKSKNDQHTRMNLLEFPDEILRLMVSHVGSDRSLPGRRVAAGLCQVCHRLKKLARAELPWIRDGFYKVSTCEDCLDKLLINYYGRVCYAAGGRMSSYCASPSEFLEGAPPSDNNEECPELALYSNGVEVVIYKHRTTLEFRAYADDYSGCNNPKFTTGYLNFFEELGATL
jgi:hypothetical protein